MRGDWEGGSLPLQQWFLILVLGSEHFVYLSYLTHLTLDQDWKPLLYNVYLYISTTNGMGSFLLISGFFHDTKQCTGMAREKKCLAVMYIWAIIIQKWQWSTILIPHVLRIPALFCFCLFLTTWLTIVKHEIATHSYFWKLKLLTFSRILDSLDIIAFIIILVSNHLNG